ncbi:hypothetical protein [Clostridium sardiniense]|uniref:hypothetical protein n=1 Tax=Clostridium sardiniense TaxID=29369 RepID=UPI00195A8665|nr:hypothetical protein [Clostridium sardiniense]MBM7835721.1 Sec-independent protein translocase protein TatA [Clostridium sardiniense]
MKEEQIVLFEGNEVKVKTDKGETLVNLVHTAKCCGLTQKGRREGSTKIYWRSLKDKLSKISVVQNSTPQRYKEEVSYISDLIENTDDRNSIFMSSWLSKRLAMECHSEKAMAYKNFLATLDEKREHGELSNQVNSNQLTQMVTETIKGVLPTLITEVGKTFGEVVKESKKNVDEMKEAIHIQSTLYDEDRAELKRLIGFKAANTKAMSLKLKDVLEERYNRKIKATDDVYIKYKNRIFNEFHVSKWEDIPALKQNSVYSFIEECLI